MALGLTVGAAVFAAALAGFRSARIEPSGVNPWRWELRVCPFSRGT